MSAEKPEEQFTLRSILIKSTLVHTATYFVMGLISSTLFDYATRYTDPLLSNFMRQIDHPLVAAGPLFQVVRGLLFGLVFYLLREIYFARRYGWLPVWITLVVLGVISTFGPSPCSIEGLIYSTVPLNFHLIGLPEVIGQSFLLAFCTHYWVRNAEKKWLSWLFGIIVFLVVLMSTLGILASNGLLTVPSS